jgi:hypothetical protein
MPRKAAAPADGSAPEPRRSSRIKDLPKTEEPELKEKKAPAKPRAKKDAAEPAADGEAPAKPKSTARGKKRTADEAAEGDAETAEPPTKKVCVHHCCMSHAYTHHELFTGQARFEGCL